MTLCFLVNVNGGRCFWIDVQTLNHQGVLRPCVPHQWMLFFVVVPFFFLFFFSRSL